MFNDRFFNLTNKKTALFAMKLQNDYNTRKDACSTLHFSECGSLIVLSKLDTTLVLLTFRTWVFPLSFDLSNFHRQRSQQLWTTKCLLLTTLRMSTRIILPTFHNEQNRTEDLGEMETLWIIFYITLEFSVNEYTHFFKGS